MQTQRDAGVIGLSWNWLERQDPDWGRPGPPAMVIDLINRADSDIVSVERDEVFRKSLCVLVVGEFLKWKLRSRAGSRVIASLRWIVFL